MALRSDLEKFLRERFHFEDADVNWIEDNHDQILAGDIPGAYFRFFIQEKDKKREIEAPCVQLKRIQRRLMRTFFYRFGAPKSAHGFVKGRSPITNARAHCDWAKANPDPENCLLQIDIKAFFHAVPVNEILRVIGRILERRFDRSLSDPLTTLILEMISCLCLQHGRLPMGAPTSPVISNLVMARFDASAVRYADRNGYLYTRYADDITVHGPKANRAYAFLKSRLERMGLEIKPTKTRVLRRHRSMLVTGVTTNSGEPTVSRKYRRRVRAQIHHTHLALLKAKSFLGVQFRPVPLPTLIGRASWIASVNPRHRLLLAKAKELRRIAAEGP